MRSPISASPRRGPIAAPSGGCPPHAATDAASAAGRSGAVRAGPFRQVENPLRVSPANLFGSGSPSSFSAANSRMTWSSRTATPVAVRASATGRTRLLSTSEVSPSSVSMPELAFGIAHLLGRLDGPAARKDRQAGEQAPLCRFAAGRSSSRSLRAASAGGPGGRGGRWRERAGAARAGRGSLGLRIFTRAAASSMASGRPSRRRQISAMAGRCRR